ncbi:GNAT family N-acetyltransferase [Rhizosphaericola mali]|uniref:GNAT family N-acetyltransferase n=1 Tax=Rhizosphaericola mali TaxID=2545455 RepID=A0A5P2FZP4_9BACT|nr:GNAT family N-acetyltransferase [Rhizosphaericola mali]QES88996.1 GNAT family N-acetyltransferase [Rhizosphaericola mali]
MKEIEIKPLNNMYTEACIQLILNIQQNEFGVPITRDDQPDLLDIEKFYLNDGGIFLGAFVENKLVGTIAYLNMGHHAAAMRKMFVAKEYRGKEWKIGQQLLDRFEMICKEKNIQDVYLGTFHVLEAAQKFYKKNDYIQIEKVKLPSYFPLMQVDDVFFHKNLENAISR